MSEPADPAAARFMMLQLVRLSGASLVLLGALILSRRVSALAGVPEFAAYGIVAVGMVDFFVLPMMFARRWRTPK